MEVSILDTLSKAGIDLINFTKNTAGQILAFVEKQAPLLLQEWVSWNFWTSFITFWGAFSIMITTLYLLIRSLKKCKAPGENPFIYSNRWRMWFTEEDDAGMIGGIVSIAFLVISFMVASFNLAWVQILFAPRLWILEHIHELTRFVN